MLVKITPNIFVNSEHVMSIEFHDPADDATIYLSAGLGLSPGYYHCSQEAAAYMLTICNSAGGETSGLGSALVLPGETPRATEDGGVGFWRCDAKLFKCSHCSKIIFNAANVKPCECGSQIYKQITCGSAVPDNLSECDFCNAPRPASPAPPFANEPTIEIGRAHV